jgi:hypothetical protein
MRTVKRFPLLSLLAAGLVALALLAEGLAAPAAAGDYTLEHRPQVVFKGNTVHVSPYPQSRRSASVWASDACWQDCKASCTWKMESCVRVKGTDTCVPHLDSCDRACQRSCRDAWSGPLLGFLDW